MLKLNPLFGVVVVFLFLVIDQVSSFMLKIARDGLVQRSSSLFLSLRQPTTGNDHALRRLRMTRLLAAKAASTKTCPKCSGKEVLACVPCKGTGIDKVNGSVLERWCCKKCKGFGMLPCSCSNSKGLTPEQSGER